LMPQWLEELETSGHIRCYEYEEKSYLDIPNWLKHQKIDHPAASKLPGFSRELAETSRNLASGSRSLAPDLIGKEGNGSRIGGDRDRKGPGPGPSLEITRARADGRALANASDGALARGSDTEELHVHSVSNPLQNAAAFLCGDDTAVSTSIGATPEGKGSTVYEASRSSGDSKDGSVRNRESGQSSGMEAGQASAKSSSRLDSSRRRSEQFSPSELDRRKQHLGISPDQGLDYRAPPSPYKSESRLEPLPDRPQRKGRKKLADEVKVSEELKQLVATKSQKKKRHNRAAAHEQTKQG